MSSINSGSLNPLDPSILTYTDPSILQAQDAITQEDIDADTLEKERIQEEILEEAQKAQDGASGLSSPSAASNSISGSSLTATTGTTASVGVAPAPFTNPAANDVQATEAIKRHRRHGKHLLNVNDKI
ncbi:hypothetical protein [Candidatus Protochlamydia phocaeensis]|uniref:hypothetical protein n=1 Tax=Candidatus Protochlamydia phocaeensis TaxID=1414722 RepID=UPI00083850A3|nr:hypothetical protein [Candidatus Protochlamydia phocaeensis]